SGSLVVTSKLLFNSSSPVPSEALVLSAINTLRNSRESQLNESVKVVNVTYEKITATSYAVIFNFILSNISMSKDPKLRNGTYLQAQGVVTFLNSLLNEPGRNFKSPSRQLHKPSNQIDGRMESHFQDRDAIQPVRFLMSFVQPTVLTTAKYSDNYSKDSLAKILLDNSSAPVIKFQAADFTGNSAVIQAKVEYVISPSDITQPSIFVQELLQLAEETTLTTTSPPILSRKAIITIRLEFITLGPRPSENSVLEVVKSMLAANLTTKLTARTVSVSDPVILTNVNYLGINDTAYALIFTFEISKVLLTELKRNETYQEIQNKINDLVIQILKDPSVNLLIPAHFKENSTVIEANVTYVFSQYASNTGAGFLVNTLFTVFTTPVPTTMSTTISNNSTNAAWVVAIIVPCAIIIGLVPCWILLCCLLCGCCAAIRRRWHRRRSYNVQYTTRNSLF
ncbi:hypothetical protein cypCar_00046590, partial [Cyprinus carpio]